MTRKLPTLASLQLGAASARRRGASASSVESGRLEAVAEYRLRHLSRYLLGFGPMRALFRRARRVVGTAQCRIDP
jgi:hypothetical protein